ncbi:hypothetical protein LCGC14_2772420 [marine sediment metagenome]|uniref:Uncharacterized protein n=1 Tax=marine sediment metagenome TaxID=412755 RepID=A0A0F9BMC9_9ZZZZ
MFDADMILLDGSIDLNAANDAVPTSVTRDAATGGAVIDIGEGGTPASGLVAVLIGVDSANGSTDTLTAFIESSDNVAFGSVVHELGKFDKLAATKGIILGAEVAGVFMLRFSTTDRYIRLNATVGTSPDDFGTVYCFLTPNAFGNVL